MREEMERKLDLVAVDIYGLSEIMGPGVAIECHEAKKGLHVFEDHFIAEIIDPETMEPMPHGEIWKRPYQALFQSQGMPLSVLQISLKIKD